MAGTRQVDSQDWNKIMNIQEGTRRVDRFDSPYQSIREYQDRRMMKWNPFATAELAQALREYRASEGKETPTSELDPTQKFEILNFSKISNEAVEIILVDGQKTESVFGTVYEWTAEAHAVICTLSDNYKEIELENILDIQALDDNIGMEA